MGHENSYRNVRARSRASSRSKPVSLTLRWILQYRRFNMGASQQPETNRKNTTCRIKQFNVYVVIVNWLKANQWAIYVIYKV